MLQKRGEMVCGIRSTDPPVESKQQQSLLHCRHHRSFPSITETFPTAPTATMTSQLRPSRPLIKRSVIATTWRTPSPNHRQTETRRHRSPIVVLSPSSPLVTYDIGDPPKKLAPLLKISDRLQRTYPPSTDELRSSPTTYCSATICWSPPVLLGQQITNPPDQLQ